MIEVVFRRDSRNRLSSVLATGHAFRGDPGQDVVCAAVSAILQSAWAGLTEVAGVPVSGRRESGDLEMRWPEGTREREDVVAIVRTAEVSIEQIARQEPEAIRCRREDE